MIYLASQSPRRKQLLQQLDVEFEILTAMVDEQWDGMEQPETYVRRLALEKARKGHEQISTNGAVLAADTIVVLNGTIFGKPVDKAAALSMLNHLSNQVHTVYTAVALAHDKELVKLSTNYIRFKELSKNDCQRYVDTGEPMDKAGAYAVQGGAAAFITRLKGSFSGVMGLPLNETRQLLQSI